MNTTANKVNTGVNTPATMNANETTYRVMSTTSGIYSDFTDRHIAEKELQNLINNGKTATLTEIAQ